MIGRSVYDELSCDIPLLFLTWKSSHRHCKEQKLPPKGFLQYAFSCGFFPTLFHKPYKRKGVVDGHSFSKFFPSLSWPVHLFSFLFPQKYFVLKQHYYHFQSFLLLMSQDLLQIWRRIGLFWKWSQKYLELCSLAAQPWLPLHGERFQQVP